MRLSQAKEEILILKEVLSLANEHSNFIRIRNK